MKDKFIIFLVLLSLTSTCFASMFGVTQMDIYHKAVQYDGLTAKKDFKVLKDLMGIDPRSESWCADFMNGILKSEGIKGTGSPAALSFLKWGHKVTKPVEGDLVILTRGGGYGHVGFFVKDNHNGTIVVFGGNESHMVRDSNFRTDNVLAYREVN